MQKIVIAVFFVCACMILGFNTTSTEASDPIGFEDRKICQPSTGNCVTATIEHSCDDASCPKL